MYGCSTMLCILKKIDVPKNTNFEDLFEMVLNFFTLKYLEFQEEMLLALIKQSDCYFLYLQSFKFPTIRLR